jgi:hypothetical protein
MAELKQYISCTYCHDIKLSAEILEIANRASHFGFEYANKNRPVDYRPVEQLSDKPTGVNPYWTALAAVVGIALLFALWVHVVIPKIMGGL